eukprot:COSAG02_NODE_97_length_37159_cov_37.660335_4_plen_64_part_00
MYSHGVGLYCKSSAALYRLAHYFIVTSRIVGVHRAQSIDTVALVYSRLNTFGVDSLHIPKGEL